MREDRPSMECYDPYIFELFAPLCKALLTMHAIFVDLHNQWVISHLSRNTLGILPSQGANQVLNCLRNTMARQVVFLKNASNSYQRVNCCGLASQYTIHIYIVVKYRFVWLLVVFLSIPTRIRFVTAIMDPSFCVHRFDHHEGRVFVVSNTRFSKRRIERVLSGVMPSRHPVKRPE